jgi:hypothetical protein
MNDADRPVSLSNGEGHSHRGAAVI